MPLKDGFFAIPMPQLCRYSAATECFDGPALYLTPNRVNVVGTSNEATVLTVVSIFLLSLLGFGFALILAETISDDDNDNETETETPTCGAQTITGTVGDDFLVAHDSQLVRAEDGDDRVRVLGDTTVQGGVGSDIQCCFESAEDAEFYVGAGDDRIDTSRVTAGQSNGGSVKDHITSGSQGVARGG
ncbi:hypothetical protein [Shimia abyssi]|uniref:Uncharacterized protein n=1 Tax=Shimia abyssi TaxID=1662395 RepID=A0A2P8F7I9_9RHOB|nr:hypothetical protein [Shimia abyssi]PSL17680.1 hypothetical protein CLV88_11527 [Shimia abyssi]